MTTEKIDANDILSAEGPEGLIRRLREPLGPPLPPPPTPPGRANTNANTNAKDDGPALRNFTTAIVEDEDGKKKVKTSAIPIMTIMAELFEHTQKWPRCASKILFHDQGGKIQTLETYHDFISWAHKQLTRVQWHNGACSDGNTTVTKQEFYDRVLADTQSYDAVEEFPHFPEFATHYYAWKSPQNYTPTGEYFDRLLEHFDNPKLPEDKILIEAALMTPAWGGRAGRRPAIVIMADDVGCGKSTLATCIGEIYGGHLELALTHNAEDKMISRLLTPSSLTKRVVRIDNIKLNYDSAFVEGLITAPTISGHRLFHGDAARPNTMTFLLTGNGLQLSRDIAERSIVIRLAKPPYRAGWEDSVINFVAEHRDKILADIVARLRAPGQSVEDVDRYTDWAHGVLAHCRGDANAAMALNRSRRVEADETAAEVQTILQAIYRAMDARHEDRLNNIRQGGEDVDDVEKSDHEFFTSTEIAEIINRAMGEHLTTNAAGRRMRNHIAAGRMMSVKFMETRNSNGFTVSL